MPPLMLCGHTANATTGTGQPACAICAGLTEDATRVDPDQPELAGRHARCPDCKTVVPSGLNLAFFQHRPDSEFDSHYDGCRGWD